MSLLLRVSTVPVTRRDILMKRMKRMKRGSRGEAGFTLIEILVVIAIIGLVMGLVGPRVLNYLSDSKVKAARQS